MDAIFEKFHFRQKGNGPKRFTVVAVCEDSITEARAIEFCHSLGCRLGNAGEIIRHVWLLSELRVAPLRAIAAREAENADLVIVSVHPARALPIEIAGWLDQWLAHKTKQNIILLALFDPASDGVSALLQASLESMARKAKIEFIARAGEHVAVLD